jgi:hypothetical protein
MRKRNAADEPARTPRSDALPAAPVAGASPRRASAAPSAAPCPTCRGHTVIDRGLDVENGADLIEECPDC